MPNLMVDFVKGFSSMTEPESLTQLKTDAAEIFNTVIGGARTANEKYKEMRRSGSFKKAVDYMFHRGEEYSTDSSLDDNADEFDPGVDFGGGESEDVSPRVLDYEGMKGLAKGQVSAMYEIGGKQAEAAAMNSAEIITTINTRSSEILSSLTTINTNLSNISSRLDRLLEVYTGKSSAGDYYGRSTNILSGGGITLGSAMQFLTGSAGSKINEYKSYAEMAMSGLSAMRSMMGAGGLGKGEAIGMGVGMAFSMAMMDGPIARSKFGKMVNDASSKVNDAISNVQNDLLTKLFSWDKFKNFFGDMTRRTANQDYGSYVENKYNRDRAVFDNVTRKTIVDIIPGYLRKITQALTGQEFFVSNEGLLTTNPNGGFRDTFRTALGDGMSSRDISKANSKKSDLSDSDLYTAQRILVAVYVGEFLQDGTNLVKSSIFETGGMPEANNRAIELLAGHNGKDRNYWSRAVGWVVAQLQLDRRLRGNFVRALNNQIKSTDKALENYARTANYTADIGTMDRELQDEALKNYLGSAGGDERTYADLIREGIIKQKDVPVGVDKNSRASDEAMRKAARERIRQSELIGNIGQSVNDIAQQTTNYIASIFDLLNRGINVYATPRTKPFSKMAPHKAKRIDGRVTTPSGTLTPETKSALNELPTDGGGSGGNAQIDNSRGGQPGQQPDKVWNGMGGWLQDKFGGAVDNIRDDIDAAKNYTATWAADKLDTAIVKRSLKSDDISESDKQIAQGVLAAMQAAVQDGDTSEDLGALSQEISNIKNADLRSRLQNIVSGTLARAEKKPAAKSSIGKILLWGFGLVKKFVTPVLSKAKSFITTIGKNIVGPILGFMKKNLVSGTKKVISGAKNMAQGMFGSDESAGLFGDVYGGMLNIGKKIAGGVGYVASKAASGIKSIADKRAEKHADDPDYWMDKFEKEMERAEKKRVKNEKKLEKLQKKMEAREEKGPLSERIKNAISSSLPGKIASGLADKIKNSSFGKGFASAFKKDMKPQTLADQSTKNISDAIKDKNGMIGGKETVLTRMLIKLGDILNAIVDPGDGGGGDGDDGENTGKKGQSSTKSTSSKSRSIGFDIGKIFGGMTKVLMGIGQQVLAIIAGMSGFKALMELGTQILKTSLKPLNKVFQKVYVALKPIVKTITKTLTEIVEYVVQICESIINFIQPILEAIGPIIEQLMSVLNPILNMITDLVNVLMVPLVAVMKSVVVPVLQTVANTLEIMLGIVQVGMGLILTVLGGILTAVGTLGKIFGAGGLRDTGKSMMTMGTNMLSSGISSVKSGFSNMGNMLVNAVTAQSSVDQQAEEEAETAKPRTIDTSKIPASIGSPMDGVTGNGDIYGGAGQTRYGNYMNMSKRGCGPVALADAYSRRTGSSVNAMQLTNAMSKSGAYSTSAGTSVGGYMNTSRALGMNLTAGGVTERSLSYASPSNPITVVGSGPVFSTRPGNNHYMNVIGTSNGLAYVSNPLSGYVERKPVSALASSSLMGLYGSGDELDDTGFHFPDAVKDIFSKLKSIVGNIFSMFELDKEDTTAEALEKEQYTNNVDYLMSQLPEDKRAEVDVLARETFEAENARYEGESDGDYDKRYEQRKEEYRAKAAAKILNDYRNANPNAASFIDKDLTNEDGSSIVESWSSNMAESDDSVTQGQFMSQIGDMAGADGAVGNFVPGSTGFYSKHGAQLATGYLDPKITSPNVLNGTGHSAETPLHEFFNRMTKGVSTGQPWSSDGNWYKQRKHADASGQGRLGDSHSGVDFVFRGSGLHEPEIPATTAGTIDRIVLNDASMGNAVYWKDTGGDIHKYYHLSEAPYTYVGGQKKTLAAGDIVEGGAILGRVGNTGNSYGSHLHYTIQSNGANVNPLTFFQYMYGQEAEESIYGNTSADEAARANQRIANQNAKIAAEKETLRNTKSSGGMTSTGNATIDAMLGIQTPYEKQQAYEANKQNLIDYAAELGQGTIGSGGTQTHDTSSWAATYDQPYGYTTGFISLQSIWPGYFAKKTSPTGDFVLYNSNAERVCNMKLDVNARDSWGNLDKYDNLKNNGAEYIVFIDNSLGYSVDPIYLMMTKIFKFDTSLSARAGAYYAWNCASGKRLPADFIKITASMFDTSTGSSKIVGPVANADDNSGINVIRSGVSSGFGSTSTLTQTSTNIGRSDTSAYAESNDGTNVIRGGGDASSIVPLDIPPLDTSRLENTSGMSLISQFTSAMNRNGSEVTAAQFNENMSQTDRLKRILTNTYNVKSEKIEGMLTEMLKLMREKNQQRKNRRIQAVPKGSDPEAKFPSSNIPKQVQRLSIG